MIRCGVDMIECARIAAGIERGGERFLNRFFTAGERQDCADKPYRLAARFAGKEAVAKALGSGIGDIRWVDIEIRTAEARRPQLIMHGKAKEMAREMGLAEWDISLSHSEALAIAVAVAKSAD
ncbi:MAG: holo-ACP synthase [Chloroflexota bacterium]|nr:holo-ACP synthase [Chloroflexota bacterium]MDE2852946.1 holo-ACP synthase [Chloroflexota bacterium]MDE2948252.1 holo-ACP synthase [Chloroflexota bacterium]